MLEILARELATNMAQLSGSGVDQPIYYLGYDMVASEQLRIEAEDGVLVRDEFDDNRSVDVDIRVGSRRLDNSHSVDGEYSAGNGLGSGSSVSLEDDELSLAQSLWLETEHQYHAAVSALREVESSEQLRSEGREHPDFSKEKPTVFLQPEVGLDFAAVAERMRPLVQAASAELGADPRILRSDVSLAAEVDNHYLVNSEGTRVQTGAARLRILIEAQAQAEDGMRLELTETFEAHDPAQLPDRHRLLSVSRKLRGDLLALLDAPIAAPHNGPAVLQGRAAGMGPDLGRAAPVPGPALAGLQQEIDAGDRAPAAGGRALAEGLDIVAAFRMGLHAELLDQPIGGDGRLCLHCGQPCCAAPRRPAGRQPAWPARPRHGCAIYKAWASPVQPFARAAAHAPSRCRLSCRSWRCARCSHR